MVDLMITTLLTADKTINDSGCDSSFLLLKPSFLGSVELSGEIMSFLYRATPRELDAFCYYVDPLSMIWEL